MISKILKEEQKKIAEKERKMKEEESALLCKSCASDLVLIQIQTLTDHSVPNPEEKCKKQERNKDCATDYNPPSPIYMASYEEDTPTLVNKLVPESTPKEEEEDIK